MTNTLTRVALGLAAALVSVGVYAGAQDQDTNQTPPPFRGRGMQEGPRGWGGPGGPGRFGGGPMGILPMFARELQLTDAQRDQLKSIAESHRDEWKALADRARTAHDALLDAVTADAVDEALIRDRSAAAAAVEADMAVARAHAYAEALQVLTAQQKTRLQELRADMKKRGPHPPRPVE